MPDGTVKGRLLGEDLVGFEKFTDRQTLRRASSAKITKPSGHRSSSAREE